MLFYCLLNKSYVSSMSYGATFVFKCIGALFTFDDQSLTYLYPQSNTLTVDSLFCEKSYSVKVISKQIQRLWTGLCK